MENIRDVCVTKDMEAVTSTNLNGFRGRSLLLANQVTFINKIEVITKSGRCGVTFQHLKETDSSQDAQIQSSPSKTVRNEALFGFLGCLTAALSRSDQAADFPSDCSKIRPQSPRAPSGVYLIQPTGSQTRFRVFCEMRQTDGWIVIQRRTGPLVSFDRTWAEYRNGFGSLTYDHWLGLEKVHILTKDTNKVWTLRVDLWDHEGGRAFAEYRDFRIGDEGTSYRLHVGTYNGTAGDAIRFSKPCADQNGAGFSTVDRDNDKCSPCIHGDVAFNSCTVNNSGGGWWYSNCGSAALNGEWHYGNDPIGWSSGLHWLTWKPMPYSAMITRMMIKSD
ncbi:fibrinogen-like protein 1 [Poeciliopsis prolifica]|uniref:fibrinogen-like protein 1 n=1 Tax=Poeciliopsis prolifica TaxID=188132 RepID=UPI002414605B|nr:fibrinogen-like protein 1 [Poeciliopsis prolifica]